MPSCGCHTAQSRIHSLCGRPFTPSSPSSCPLLPWNALFAPQGSALTVCSFLHQSLLSCKSVELGQGDLNSVWSRWKQVPGCSQVEGALSRQRLGMAS